MRWVLGIDPGASTGMALFEGERFVAATTAEGTSFLSLAAAIEKLVKPYWSQMANRQAVIEAGYMGLNRKTALVLERRRGLVQAACELHQFAVAELFPSQWQSKVLKHLGEPGTGPGRPRRNELKKRALQRAAEISCGPVASSDAADAICMTYCYSLGLHLPGA